ncbi:hypothetical protein [Microcoleus phage My-WqHQDG]|nr:hypothetical protein [Microcoleus phage My-WqHQDG]
MSKPNNYQPHDHSEPIVFTLEGEEYDIGTLEEVLEETEPDDASADTAEE